MEKDINKHYIIYIDAHLSTFRVENNSQKKNNFLQKVRQYIEEEKVKQKKLPKILYIAIDKTYMPNKTLTNFIAAEDKYLRLYKNEKIMKKSYTIKQLNVYFIAFDTLQMSKDGYKFIQDKKGIWYTTEIPTKYSYLI